MTLDSWLKYAREQLEASDDPDAEWDARVFLCAVTGLELSSLRFESARELPPDKEQQLEQMLLRRKNGEPEQYIEGRAWFMGIELEVDPRVLIPRQDTETLCEFALETIKELRCPRVLDLCTGSGALAVAIAKLRPDAQVTASDLSLPALEVAKKNAGRTGVMVSFLQGEGFEPLNGQAFDLIVCNPPYLSERDMRELQKEVRAEPEMALYGGEDGLDFYRSFSVQAGRYLRPDGVLAFEVGAGQADTVREYLIKSGAASTGKVKDLCGIERVVYMRK